jgi:putative MFS transporter
MFGWRPMFVIAGVGALIVWYLRKNLPESPRWLEIQGHHDEAEALLVEIEREASRSGPLPPPALPVPPQPPRPLGDLFRAPLLSRLVVGSLVLIVINTLIFGFVTWLPTFFVRQGLSIAQSFSYTLVIVLGSPLGCAIGAFAADAIGRRWTILLASAATVVFGAAYPFVGADPTVMLSVGFLLIVAIYVQVAVLFGVYTPELFPTELRLRANGLCNTLGRAATVVSPFIVLWLFRGYGVGGVLALMIALVLVQMVAVWGWGVEPAGRPLEAVGDTRPAAAD